MTEKELKRLSRADLLDLLIDQSKVLQKTKKRLHAAQTELENRQIAIQNAGSIAEASLKLNGVFDAAQASCVQYMENIRSRSEQQQEICRQMERECQEKISRRLEETRQRCETMEEETRRQCEAMEQETRDRCIRMLKKAKREARAYREGLPRK